MNSDSSDYKNHLKIFSYGSNNMNQLKIRIERQTDINFNSAYLDNYTRIFAGFSQRWKGGVASIYPSPNKRVYGSVFYLTMDEIEKLDKFEGGYSRMILKVKEKFKEVFQETQAFLYIKNNPYYSHMPSEDYLNAISRMLYESDQQYKNSIKIKGVDENDQIREISVWVKN